MRTSKGRTQYQRRMIVLEKLQAPRQIGRFQEQIDWLHVLETECALIIVRVAFAQAQYHAGAILAAHRRDEAEASAEAAQTKIIRLDAQ